MAKWSWYVKKNLIVASKDILAYLILILFDVVNNFQLEVRLASYLTFFHTLAYGNRIELPNAWEINDVTLKELTLYLFAYVREHA